MRLLPLSGWQGPGEMGCLQPLAGSPSCQVTDRWAGAWESSSQGWRGGSLDGRPQVLRVSACSPKLGRRVGFPRVVANRREGLLSWTLNA